MRGEAVTEIETGIVGKRRDILILFKSMQQILSTEQSWFDGHGNLCVYTYNGKEQLAPAYFCYLGKQKAMKSHHSFPTWCIEREWDDLFAPNIALRAIAKGNMTLEEIGELARKSVLVP